MGTPFISHLPPSKLEGYDRTKTHDQQPPHIPQVFKDAMSVREAVYVREQNVPLQFEHDADDARSCHWVVYASVNQTTQPEERSSETGEVVQPRKSEHKSVPVGTFRAVPFPHPPHPEDGGRYVDNILQTPESQKRADGVDDGVSSAPTTDSAVAGDEGGGGGANLSPTDSRRQSEGLPFGSDRATTYHDGKEPYVKVGRMAVIPEFRGHRISGQLWAAARKWLEDNPAFFNPSVRELGMDQMKVGDNVNEIPKWNGLVCAHAQESVIKRYERWGFKVDEGMGRWYEEGIPHIGMFVRLRIESTDPVI